MKYNNKLIIFIIIKVIIIYEYEMRYMQIRQTDVFKTS